MTDHVKNQLCARIEGLEAEKMELNEQVDALQKERDALKAEHEKRVSYTQNGIECFASPCPEHSGVNTPPFSEFWERYGRLCLICVVDERDALAAHVESARPVVEAYRRQIGGALWALDDEELVFAEAEEWLAASPETSLARLKVQWQAKALENLAQTNSRELIHPQIVMDMAAELRRQAEGGEA